MFCHYSGAENWGTVPREAMWCHVFGGMVPCSEVCASSKNESGSTPLHEAPAQKCGDSTNCLPSHLVLRFVRFEHDTCPCSKSWYRMMHNTSNVYYFPLSRLVLSCCMVCHWYERSQRRTKDSRPRNHTVMFSTPIATPLWILTYVIMFHYIAMLQMLSHYCSSIKIPCFITIPWYGSVSNPILRILSLWEPCWAGSLVGTPGDLRPFVGEGCGGQLWRPPGTELDKIWLQNLVGGSFMLFDSMIFYVVAHVFIHGSVLLDT